MRRLDIKAQARTDIVEIWTHIAQESKSTAIAVVTRLSDAMEALIVTPGMGHARADVSNAQLRFWNRRV